jgi:hypothetical protein
MKRKTFFQGLYVAVVYAIVIFAMTSCNPHRRPAPEKQATLVINHSDKDIIIETLHEGSLKDGVYKFSIDSNEYIVFQAHYNACAIVKHN